ncbi:MAG: radical SAM protein [Rubrivivax sp.]|nr:radical SAM protein [Rubrivivax sp.]
MSKVMDGLNSSQWIPLGPFANGWVVEVGRIPARDKGKYGYDLWSNGLAFEAFGIGRTYKVSVRAPGRANGMWLLNFDTQGRMVNASFTGSRWGEYQIPAPTFEHDFRLLSYPRHRPEMHRLIGGTWVRGKWTDRYAHSRLVYQAEIVSKHDPLYQSSMHVLDEVVAAINSPQAVWNGAAAAIVHTLRMLPLKSHAQLLDEARRFHTILDIPEQISVEPPELAFDHYHAIPVKVQGGCGGPCTFCDLYDRKIRVLPAQIVERQIDSMAVYLGEELDHFLKVVLLEGDALTVPAQQLGHTLSYARRRFELADAPFAHAFAKASTVIKKSQDELSSLRESGLLNVNIGAETGSQDILNLVKRGQKVDACLEAVEKLRKARIGVSLNIIAGIGGARFHDQHVSETVEFLRHLPAGVEVFYAPLQVHPDARYNTQHFGDLSPEEVAMQVQIFQREAAAKEYIFIPM